MDGHKHCQKCLQVMRWINTLSKVNAGHEMDEDKLSSVQVMRWTNTLSNVSAGHEIDGHKH